MSSTGRVKKVAMMVEHRSHRYYISAPIHLVSAESCLILIVGSSLFKSSVYSLLTAYKPVTGSIVQPVWPKERISTHLCVKCGDCFHSDLHKLNYDETVHRLRLGLALDELEHADYSKLVDDAQRQMDRLQLELRRMQNLSRALEVQRELLEAYMAGLRSMTSPIHKVPQEVLGEIFKYICCGDIGVNCITPNALYTPTMTISRVCLRWYNIVTSMPVLWSSFGTQFLDSETLDSDSTSSLVCLFLERSRLHPIDFSLIRRSFSFSYSIPSSLVIIENTNRWRHVVIHAQESLIVKMLQPLIDDRLDLPVLTSLDLLSSFDPEEFLLGLLSFPMGCPNLRSLTLKGVPLNLEYPRTTITTLNLTGLSSGETCQIILHCPNVQNLVVKNFIERNIDIRAPTNIGSNTLNLTVEFGHNPDSLQRFCDSMICSKLTHLELSNERCFSDVDHITLICSMLERGHVLTHLAIRYISDFRGLVRLFRCAASVTTLEIEHTDEAAMILKALIAHNQNAESKQIETQSGNFDKEEEGEDEDASDDYDYESADYSDGEDDDIAVSQCLLPQLTDLIVVNRSYSQSYSQLLPRLVRSRWRPLFHEHSQDSHTTKARNLSVNPCVYLKKLRIESTRFNDHEREGFPMLRKNLEPFKKDGLDVEVIT